MQGMWPPEAHAQPEQHPTPAAPPQQPAVATGAGSEHSTHAASDAAAATAEDTAMAAAQTIMQPATATSLAQPSTSSSGGDGDHDSSSSSSSDVPAWQQRTQLLIKEEGLRKLRAARVLVVGVGGVGSFVAEFLAR